MSFVHFLLIIVYKTIVLRMKKINRHPALRSCSAGRDVMRAYIVSHLFQSTDFPLLFFSHNSLNRRRSLDDKSKKNLQI